MRDVKLITKVDLGSGEYRICEFPGPKMVRRSIDDFQTKTTQKTEIKQRCDSERRMTLSNSPKKKSSMHI
jgi:hypothetical protein